MTARTLAWTGFLAIAAFVLMGASRLTLLDPVENVTLNVTSPLQRVLSDTTRPVADWVNNLTERQRALRRKPTPARGERTAHERTRARA